MLGLVKKMSELDELVEITDLQIRVAQLERAVKILLNNNTLEKIPEWAKCILEIALKFN